VALIGPFGAGKSLVRQALERHGAATLDFDSYSRELLRPGTPQFQQVRAHFGDAYLFPDGTLHRAALGRLVFADDDARHALNAIVHPAMLARLREAVAAFRRAPTAPALAVEGALLGQLAPEDLFDVVLSVQAPAAVRALRLQERDGLTAAEAQGRLALHERLGLGAEPADFVLDNSGDLEQAEAQVAEFWRRFVAPPEA
jgi:dephospho-CoA kinase